MLYYATSPHNSMTEFKIVNLTHQIFNQLSFV